MQGPRLRPPARYVITKETPRIDVDTIAGSEDLRSRFASSVQLACACVSQTTAGTCEPEQEQTPAFAQMTNSGRCRDLLLAGEFQED